MNLCEIVTWIIRWIECLIYLCKVFIWLMVFLNTFLKYFLQKRKQRDTAELDSTSCPEFIQELLPSAKRTALLYHLSYLCLGNFPELERLIRKRALEIQLLFGSSEALLVKCEGTSEKLVTSLLPNLKVTVEKNKPQLALKLIEKAQGWISDIIMDVKEIVKRYEKHNSDVAATTSDIITETMEKEKKQQQTREMKKLQKIIDGQMRSIRSLDEVQKSLSQIQKNLVQLQKFWEKVGSKLEMLKERTFAREDWIDDLTDMKKEFLEFIDVAEEGWTQFGNSCMKANNIFSIQMNQAYRFLEINPSSLSEEEWQKEYESVEEKLQNIRPNTACPTLLDLAVEKWPNSDSNKPFSVITVIKCRSNAFWVIFFIFENIAYWVLTSSLNSEAVF